MDADIQNKYSEVFKYKHKLKYSIYSHRYLNMYNQSASCKHVGWKILFDSIENKLCSNQEECFMPILLPTPSMHTLVPVVTLFVFFSGKTWTWPGAAQTEQQHLFCGCCWEIRQLCAYQNAAIPNKDWCMCMRIMFGLFDFVPIQTVGSDLPIPQVFDLIKKFCTCKHKLLSLTCSVCVS